MNPDSGIYSIIGLSLYVSCSATVIASVFAVPFGVWLAITSLPYKNVFIGVLNGFTGLPPVVLGLAMYIVLSRSGILGFLDILYTPLAMILTQTVLVFPIIAMGVRVIAQKQYALTHQYYKMIRLGKMRTIASVIYDIRYWILTGVMAGLGRALSEVGAMYIVGGNIKGFTRIMTTTISLETGKGNLNISLALGGVLLCIIVGINITMAFFNSFMARNHKGML